MSYKKGKDVKKKVKGGGSDFGMLSVKAGIDKNPKATQADRIAGATRKKAMGGGMMRKEFGKGGGAGLYANIKAKKDRIKAGSGEKMAKAGDKGRPTKANFVAAAKTAKKPKKKNKKKVTA